MKKLCLLFAALTCCFAMKAQSVTYEPIMSIPSPINSDAVYYLGYQDGQDFYLHTSGTTTGQMQLSKNPENPIEYRFRNITGGVGAYLIGGDNLFLSIDTEGVAHKTFAPFSQTPFSLSIVNGDISSAAASGYTVCHDGDIITTHTGTSEGNLRFFVKLSKPSYNINVSVTPEGTGSATATIGGEQVESATEGTEITVTATPNAGYNFINWTENNEVVSTANPYTFTLTTDRNLVANFSRQYDFSAACTTGQTLYYRIIDAEKHWVSIVAPNNDTWDYAWYGFTKPKGNITLPETVTHNDISYTVKEIGNFAFSNCIDLTGSLSIPNSVTSIGENAFWSCSNFTGSLTIGSSVESIGEYAFSFCSSFTGSLIIPNSVESIGASAFSHCSGFTGSLIIGNSVASIGEQAFYDCSGFTGSLTIGSSVESIGQCAFQGCSGFTGSLTIGSSVESIGQCAFQGCSGFTGSLTIPNSVTSINASAFNACSGFTGSLTIGNSVTSIGESAFEGCLHFTGSLIIPNSVASIGESAFERCSGFTGSLTIGSSVTSIGDDAFNGCSGFSKIILKPFTPPTLGENAFAYMSSSRTITVPCDTYGIYVNIWGISFRDIMVDGFVYDLTVASANTNFGSASITQQPDCITQAIVTATPNDGCKFVNWTENGVVVSTENPYTFEMTTDHNLVANFTVTGQYNFSAACTTGQTLYYRIIDAEKHWVSIVAPNNDTWDCAWDGFTKPAGNITLPETVTHNDISYTVKAIGNSAFSLCDGLTGSLIIGSSVESIGGNAFSKCSGFTGSLTIGSSVESIGAHAFEMCSGFTGSLTIPNSVTSIGASAFWECRSFTGSLTIGSSVTIIGSSAFYDCSGFTGSLTIPNSVTSIGERAFELCSNFTGSLNIPNSVTSINASAFNACSGFTGSLTIGNSVTSIGESAFEGCLHFTGSLTIPNSVTSIGERAFENCLGFTGSLTIGSSVTSIGDYAFSCCSGFSKIILKPATPPTLGNNAFSNMSSSRTITVPCDTYGEYWRNWDSFRAELVEEFVYDLTVASANNGFGSASITQQPDCSTPAKVTATPNDGYKFVNWTENGVVVSTDNPYTFKMTTDRNLVANFVENKIRITANQDPDHKQNYYSTFYSSAVDYQVPSDVTAYTGKVEDSTSEPNTSVLKLTAIEDNIIPASQGVILKLTTNDNNETQKQFVITLTTEAGTWSGTNALTGTDVATTLGANQYALSYGQNGVGFYLWNGKEIGANKAYLTLPSPAKALTFEFNDEPSGIKETFEPYNGTTETYNLNGMRVGKDYKGIVVVRGKKYLKK